MEVEAPDAGDHWTILTFTVSAPDTATPDSDESLRTISVGDYEALFGQKSPEEIEAERQAEVAVDTLSKVIYTSGLHFQY